MRGLQRLPALDLREVPQSQSTKARQDLGIVLKITGSISIAVGWEGPLSAWQYGSHPPVQRDAGVCFLRDRFEPQVSTVVDMNGEMPSA